MQHKVLVLFAVAGLLISAFGYPRTDLATPTRKPVSLNQTLDSARTLPTKGPGAALPTRIDVNRVIQQVHKAGGPEPPPPLPFGNPFTDDEFMPAPTIVPTPGPGTQSAIAFDGTNYLVVWTDPRGDNWWDEYYQQHDNYDVYGARVNQSGVVMDTNGIAIATGKYAQTCPSVAFDGDAHYLVVWQDDRNGGYGENGWLCYYDVYGALVSTDGMPGTPFAVYAEGEEESKYDQTNPSVAFDKDNHYLVVWEDNRHGWYDEYGYWRNNYDIYGALVSTDGTPAEGFVVNADKGELKYDLMNPSVAFDKDNHYLVTWQDCRNSGTTYWDIYGALVTKAGAVDMNNIEVSIADHDQQSPSVAFGNDTTYLVVWQGYGNGIYGALVSKAGKVTALDPIAEGSTDVRYPSVAFGGDVVYGYHYLVVWQDEKRHPRYNDICGALLTTEGVVDVDSIPISTAYEDQTSPSVAFGEGNYFAAWEDLNGYRGEDGPECVVGSRVSTTGVVQDPNGVFVSHSSVNSESTSAVAFDGTNYLVVWCDDRDFPHYDICGARVTPAGVVLGDPAGFVISTNTPTSNQYNPSVAFDNVSDKFLVVWQDERGYANDPSTGMDIYGALVTAAGEVDVSDIAVSTADYDQNSPSVAFDGTNYLVVWQDSITSCIHGVRVSSTGGVDASDIAISDGGSDWSPSVTYGGGYYLVVWANDYGRICGARVDPATGLVMEGDEGGFPISTQGEGDGSHPSVAFDGTNYVAVWQAYRGPDSDICGARVNKDGQVLDANAIPICTEPSEQLYPTVAFIGPYYLVAWMEGPHTDWGPHDICGCLVDQAGGVVKRFPVSTVCRFLAAPAVACGLGKAMVTYHGPADSVGGIDYHDTTRIWARLVTLAQPNDVSSDSILRPCAHFLLPSWPVPPMVRIRNYGASDVGQFKVKLFISPGTYERETTVTSLAAGATCQLEFDPFPLAGGVYTTRCVTMLDGDPDPHNDTLTAHFQASDFVDFFDEGSGDLTADPTGHWAYGTPAWPWTFPPMDTTVWGIGVDGSAYDGNWNSTLTSPSYEALQDNPAITFQNNFSTDTGVNGDFGIAGCNFSYWTEDDGWNVLLPDAGPVYYGYVPALGDSGWAGSSYAPSGWNQSVFTIPVNKNEEFQVRWRFASGNMRIYGYGWLIDEVAGIGCAPAPPPPRSGRGSVIDTVKVWPNLVRGPAQVHYTLVKDCNVTINLYDASGRLAKQVPTSGFKKGKNTARLDASGLARGVYFVKIKGETDTRTTKVIIE